MLSTFVTNSSGKKRPSALRGFSALCAGFALYALAIGSASGQTMLTTGFEPSPASPAYTTGNLAPQNSWVANVSASAFTVVADSGTFSYTGPGGTENIPNISGSTQMVESVTTVSATSTSNSDYNNLRSKWITDSGAGATTLETSVAIFVPKDGSTLQGNTGLILQGGSLASQTNLAAMTLSYSAAGKLSLTLNPAIGTTTTITSATQPLLVKDSWLTLDTYLNYNNGNITTQVDGTTVITLNDAGGNFDTSKPFVTADLYNINHTADTTATTVFLDNYTVTATAPTPSTLPIFTPGLVAVVPWLRWRKRRKLQRAAR